MLEVKNLSVSYGAIEAVKDISFTVNDGEIVSLIGANGAGKTTTLHTITGLVPAKSGSMMYNGVDLLKTHNNKIVTLGMAHIPEGRTVSLTSETSTTTKRSLSLPTITFSQFGRDTVVTGLSGDWPINACLATSRMVGFPAFGAFFGSCNVVVVRLNCFLPPWARTSCTALATVSSAMASSRTTPRA